MTVSNLFIQDNVHTQRNWLAKYIDSRLDCYVEEDFHEERKYHKAWLARPDVRSEVKLALELKNRRDEELRETLRTMREVAIAKARGLK